jgi:hypothetical protein
MQGGFDMAAGTEFPLSIAFQIQASDPLRPAREVQPLAADNPPFGGHWRAEGRAETVGA